MEGNQQAMRQVAIIGIGMGNPELLTRRAWRLLEQAQVLIGARRMLDAVRELRKPEKEAFLSQDVIEYIENCPYDRIAVLLSGDIGFYSGAKKLQPLLQNYQVINEPGISAPVYLSSRIGRPWQDARLISLHDAQKGWLGYIRNFSSVMALTGKVTARQALQQLTDAGFGELSVAVGEKLSYPEERVWQGTARELSKREYDSLAIVWVWNPQAREQWRTGLQDEEWIRGKVPMTKREIRALVMARLAPAAGQVFWDVGAGTGSVSIEWALNVPDGRVFAIEQKGEACELIRANQKRFQVDTIQVVCGQAPEALQDLPAPDSVFIGGSGGRLKEIVEVARRKNPAVRIIVTAITMETLLELQEYQPELAQVSVSRSQPLGRYHRMEAENPVWIGVLP